MQCFCNRRERANEQNGNAHKQRGKREENLQKDLRAEVEKKGRTK